MTRSAGAAREFGRPDYLLRTRRTVMEAAHRMQTQRARQRRHAGLALLAIAALVVFFAPAIWSAATDLATGEYFTDLPVVVITVSLLFLSTMLGALLMAGRERRRRSANE